MGAFDTTTTKPIAAHGIYQSTCSCRTAVNLYAGDTAPHCLSCGKRVVWRLVQAVQKAAHAPRRTISEQHLGTAAGPDLARASDPFIGIGRRLLDSAAGE